MNSPPESSSDLEEISSTQDGGASNTPNVVTNPLTGESGGSSSPETLKKVLEEERLDFIESAALLDPDECFKRLVSSEGNIFHFAAFENKVEFMDKAMQRLPHPVKQSLLSQSSEEYGKQNPLHIAASNGYHKMVKIILDSYRPSASSSDAQSTNETTGEKPWLGLDEDKLTPLHWALIMCHERIALEILSMDVESLSGMEDSKHRGPLFVAMDIGMYRVALQILTSAANCSLSGSSGRTVLFPAANAPDEIFKLLLEKAPELIIGQDTHGDTVLHHWVKSGNIYPIEFVVNHVMAPHLKRDFIDQLSRTDSENGFNPLHCIVGSFHDDALSVEIARVLVNAYKRERAQLFSSPEFQPPWLMQDNDEKTTLDIAISFQREQLALYLLSLDPIKFFENNDDLLFHSIEKECHKVAEEILGMEQQDASLTKFLTCDHNGQNALHYAPESTETFLSKLLETHPEFIKEHDDNGRTILHSWIEKGEMWPFKYMTMRGINPHWKNSFINLLPEKDNDLRNLLHLAASSSSKGAMVDIVKLLVNATDEPFIHVTLLCEKDCNSNTPLGIAVSERRDQLAVLFLSMDETLSDVEANLIFKAIEHECPAVVKFLLDWTAKSGNEKFLTSDECNVLHRAWKSTEENGKLIVKEWPQLIGKCDVHRRTPLQTASKEGASWLVELILQADRSCILETPLAWVEACERGHLSTILAFADKSSYFKDLCLLYKDTPLHHMQGIHYRDYKALLDHELIKEMKNIQNSKGETPLHVAIKRKNIDLAEILLKMNEVERDIKDDSGNTAMDLLEAIYNQDEKWKQMCKVIGVDPTSRTTYVKPEANLTHVRDIVSLVAALLATITFTAGFTLPGGLDQGSGQAILARKAAFLAFIMSDGYAMCCSMLVLFCIIWSMVCKPDKSAALIDRSVVLLKQSLYGTLIAFMTGVYAVIHHKSLWVAIVIFGMCSVVIIASNRILSVWLPKLIPVADGSYLQWLWRCMKRRHRATPASDRVEAQERDPLNNQPEQELASMV